MSRTTSKRRAGLLEGGGRPAGPPRAGALRMTVVEISYHRAFRIRFQR